MLALTLGCTITTTALAASQAMDADVWRHVAENPNSGPDRVKLYFFWTRTCPHCQQARPAIEQLQRDLPWLYVESQELDSSAAARRFSQLAEATTGEQGKSMSVPAFIYCGTLQVGYDAAIDAHLRRDLVACHNRMLAGEPLTDSGEDKTMAAENADLPFDFDTHNDSLLVFTITLALLDSINPCAFFVLLFLLSLLVNARSRARMLLIGLIFVLVSALSYFVFMSAWLNLFLAVGHLRIITLCAGALAITMGLLNAREALVGGAEGTGSGFSLGLSKKAQPALFKRMRNLLHTQSIPLLLAATLSLAVVSNAYELLCTAGLPMVFSRVLTLRELPMPVYYGYLALYCSVYVLPLLAVLGAFVVTLGRRKLTEREGQGLKLLSGLLMLGLGGVLIVEPGWLGNLAVAALLPLVAIGATAVIMTRRRTA